MLVEYNFSTPGDLSASLIPSLEFLLKGAALKPGDIDVYGIGIGPGLFTGIRVGLATLKGFLFGQNKPVVPVVTLEALAYKHIQPGVTVIPLIDARRDEIYIAGYNSENQGKQRVSETLPPRLIHIRRLKETLSGLDNLYFLGSGAGVHMDFVKETFGTAEVVCRSSFLAAEICGIAYRQFSEGDYITDLQQLLPLYIRKPDAEINLRPK